MSIFTQPVANPDNWTAAQLEEWRELRQDLEGKVPHAVQEELHHVEMNSDTGSQPLRVWSPYPRVLVACWFWANVDVIASKVVYTTVDILDQSTGKSLLMSAWSTSDGMQKQEAKAAVLSEGVQRRVAKESAIRLDYEHVDNSALGGQEEEPVGVQLRDLWVELHWRRL